MAQREALADVSWQQPARQHAAHDLLHGAGEAADAQAARVELGSQRAVGVPDCFLEGAGEPAGRRHEDARTAASAPSWQAAVQQRVGGLDVVRDALAGASAHVYGGALVAKVTPLHRQEHASAARTQHGDSRVRVARIAAADALDHGRRVRQTAAAVARATGADPLLARVLLLLGELRLRDASAMHGLAVGRPVAHDDGDVEARARRQRASDLAVCLPVAHAGALAPADGHACAIQSEVLAFDHYCGAARAGALVRVPRAVAARDARDRRSGIRQAGLEGHALA